MISVSLDNNCIIALENNEPAAACLRELLHLHASQTISLRVLAISASEKQQGGHHLSNFAGFQERLSRIGLQDLPMLSAPARWGMTFYDQSHYSSNAGRLLEQEIHNILWPELPAELELIAADQTDEKLLKRWRNAKCDTVSFWTHIAGGGGIFVSSDDNFHKSKKDQLLELSGGDICRPQEVLRRLESGKTVSPVPPSITRFLQTSDVELTKHHIPEELKHAWANFHRHTAGA